MIKQLLTATALLLFALTAGHAATPRPEDIERSMLITGSVDIDADGGVGGHRLDQRDKLPAGVAAFVDKAVAGWRFEPILVDGQPVAAQTRMSIRLVAQQVDSTFRISVRSADFGDYDPETMPSYRTQRPPRYPEDALRSRVGGDVWAAARIGRDGRVEEVVVEQVNLRTAVSSESRVQFERQLAEASTRAIRRWTFNPPASGDEADASSWTVRVPISYMVSGVHRKAKYGQWEAYLPGTYQPAPWRPADDSARSADAVAAEGLYPLKSNGPRLLTGLEAS
jgi:hypothetical protein